MSRAVLRPHSNPPLILFLTHFTGSKTEAERHTPAPRHELAAKVGTALVLPLAGWEPSSRVQVFPLVQIYILTLFLRNMRLLLMANVRWRLTFLQASEKAVGG